MARGLAHHDPHGNGRVPLRVECPQEKRGNVHHDQLLAREVGQPAQALEGELDLPHQAFWASVQGSEGLAAQHAVRGEAKALLQACHRRDQRPLVALGQGFLFRGQVAKGPQARGQGDEAWVGVAGSELLHLGDGLERGTLGQRHVARQDGPEPPVHRVTGLEPLDDRGHVSGDLDLAQQRGKAEVVGLHVIVESHGAWVHPPAVHVAEMAEHPHGERQVEEPAPFFGEEALARILEPDEEQGCVVLKGRKAPTLRLHQSLDGP